MSPFERYSECTTVIGLILDRCKKIRTHTYIPEYTRSQYVVSCQEMLFHESELNDMCIGLIADSAGYVQLLSSPLALCFAVVKLCRTLTR